MRLLVRGRVVDNRARALAAARNVTLDVGQAGRLLDPYDPRTYANQYRLQVWLRYGIGETYGTTLNPSGTAPPAWTVSGTPTRVLAIHAEIDSVVGGTGLGQATYKWRENETAAYTTGVLTAAGPTALGTTGLSVSMAVGPYNIDNKWDLTIQQWNDQSGNGNHAIQLTSVQQPKASVLNGPTFDGVANITSDKLLFASNMTAPNGASLFASFAAGPGGADNRVFFTNLERYYYQRSTGLTTFHLAVPAGSQFADSGMVFGSTHQIVECVDRNFNDVTIGINGTLVTRTNGTSYNNTANIASIGIGAFIQPIDGAMRELLFFAKPLPAAVATYVRQGIALRTGVTLP